MTAQRPIDNLEKYFDIYKLSVEMADKISARRMTANTFFLTLHSALIVLSERFNLIYVAIVGIYFSIAWWMLLKSYRDLNAAKFEVIKKIENDFPIKPFTDEWDYLKKDPIKWWEKRYAELGQIERVVPIVIGLTYAYIIYHLAFQK